MGKKVDKIELICPNCNEKFYVRPCEVKKYIFCSVKCRKEYHAVHKICIYCGNKYDVMPSQKSSKYCSNECCVAAKYEKSLEIRICSECKKEYKIQKSSHNPFCSNECHDLWHEKHDKVRYNCDYCGEEFDLLKSKLNRDQVKFYCSHECSNKASIKGEYVHCEQCGNKVYRTQSNLNTYNHVFCSVECRAEFERKRIVKTCEYCKKEYSIKSSRSDYSKFCSRECKDKWQSENIVGENSYSWKGGSITCECAFCGEELSVKQYRFKKCNKVFCSYTCCHKYYSIPENRTDKQKLADKIFSLNAIKNIKPTLTTPHVAVNSILDKNNINYRIEEIVKYYKLDTYLINYNLAIEIQGDFWHSNPNRFKTIKYKRQLDGINRDKSKHTYVKNKYGYEILYLWEMDINKKLFMCEKLILEYIKRNGKLQNYHSFNYYIDENDNLSLKNELIIPYQEMSNEQLKKYKNIKDDVA